MLIPDRFVVDGYHRAVSALEPKLRAEVAAEYAKRLKEADDRGRRRLQHEMEREIARRLREKAPPDALY